MRGEHVLADVAAPTGAGGDDELAVPDLGHDAFGGLRAFLAAAQGRKGPVKWQLTGPITFGMALWRTGVVAPVAFDVAIRAVRVTTMSVLRAE